MSMEDIKRFESSTSGADEEGFKEDNQVLVKIGNGKEQQQENNETKHSSSQSQKNLSCGNQLEVDQLESARAEMGEVREENQRLKMCLDRLMKDYRSLQMHVLNIVQQDGNKSTHTISNHTRQEVEEPELVSLTLGRYNPSEQKRPLDERNGKNISIQGRKEDDEQVVKQDLSLKLNCKFEMSKVLEAKNSPNQSSSNSLELEAKEEGGETWKPGKILKTMRSGEDEGSQQNPQKKARVSVRARCETPTMNDGCQWRKYGQKIAKGNPCPRAYYRCTGAPSCPVRKQVQRYAEDISILITTYEGTHNHPLPISATAMASTTSAAASMLLSGSSSSRTVPNATASAANIEGLNFYLSDNSNSKQFYLPNSSLSSSPLTHPTITLDLTNSNPSLSSTPLNKFSSSTYPPRYPFTSLDFGSNNPQSNVLSWSNGLLSYANQPYKNHIPSLDIGSRQPPLQNNNIYQAYLQKNNPNLGHPSQQPPPNTIAAATKAITADPSFQSALAAALTSIIGSGSSGAGGVIGGTHQSGGDHTFGQKKSEAESFPLMLSSTTTYTQAPKGDANCASSFLNKKPVPLGNPQPGNLMFLPSNNNNNNNSLTFSATSNSASASPIDNRDQTS